MNSDDEEFAAWLRLLCTPGLGRPAMRQLLGHFGSPQAIWGASVAELRAAAGSQAVSQITRPAEIPFDHWLRNALAWRSGPGLRRFVPLGDPAYPAALLQAPDPPLALWVQGRLEALEAPALAMVGSRQASAQGLQNAQDFAGELARAGLCIVSGLAVGIDAAAHEGALVAGGLTLAVLGHGLDSLYPSQHRALASRIEAGGALLSEHAPGVPALREHFPQRNRVIAGLSLGTLVVEAAPKSGSLITARLAAEGGREVFAIPGSIHSTQSRGCHQLIQQGAKLVQSAQDVLEELGMAGGRLRKDQAPAHSSRQTAGSSAAAGASLQERVLRALGHEPSSLDSLQARTGESTASLQASLLELELAGKVASLPGGRYQRIGRA